MPIPKSINHKFLKDTIVEIRYKSNYDQELINGLFYQQLTRLGFQLRVNRPPSLPNIQISGESQFMDDTLSIKFNPNSVVFNSNGQYKLWGNYFAKIKLGISAFYELNLFESIQRIGIRYVNVFEDADIFKIVKEHFKVEIPTVNTKNTHIKTELVEESFKAILNIGNGSLMQGNKLVSVFDIDVIMEVNKKLSKEELETAIDFAHLKETEIFFGNIRDEYLRQLEPKY
jgi:uncharacterized protein (TIGR04255 family)